MIKLLKRINTKIKVHLKEFIKKVIYQFVYREINLKYQLQNLASIDTAKYINETMKGIQSVNNKFAVHDKAMENISLTGGDILEFGVFSGGTINYIAKKLPKQKIYGFDSFEGLPENWRDGFQKGKFNINKSLPMVKKNVSLIPGWFDESIPKYLKQKKQNKCISYLHIDCDLYSSTKIIFRFLEDQIITGTVIVFDEYFNYDGWREGEFLAFQEFVEERNLKYKYLTYNYLHEQVAIKIL